MTPDERIGRRLSLRDLNIFLVVVEKRSMSRAADQLAVSQPVISKAIADMEHVLGVPLLDRNPRGVEPTLYGRSLIKRGIAVFDELRQGVKDIEMLVDPAVGEVCIGATPPLVAGLVPAAVETLVQRHPRVTVEVIEGDFSILQRSLHERHCDVAIGRAPRPATDEDIESEVLFEDRLVVVAGSRNKWSRRKDIELSELLSESWVLPAPATIGAMLVSEVFHALSIKPPRARVATSSIAMNIQLVISSGFLALLPASTVLVLARHQPIKALSVALPEQPRPVVIASLKNRTPNPVAKLFVEHARAIVHSSMSLGVPGTTRKASRALVHEA
jgi:DNA-binding transcriptional LysR family regulator